MKGTIIAAMIAAAAAASAATVFALKKAHDKRLDKACNCDDLPEGGCCCTDEDEDDDICLCDTPEETADAEETAEDGEETTEEAKALLRHFAAEVLFLFCMPIQRCSRRSGRRNSPCWLQYAYSQPLPFAGRRVSGSCSG